MHDSVKWNLLLIVNFYWTLIIILKMALRIWTIPITLLLGYSQGEIFPHHCCIRSAFAFWSYLLYTPIGVVFSIYDIITFMIILCKELHQHRMIHKFRHCCQYVS